MIVIERVKRSAIGCFLQLLQPSLVLFEFNPHYLYLSVGLSIDLAHIAQFFAAFLMILLYFSQILQLLLLPLIDLLQLLHPQIQHLHLPILKVTFWLIGIDHTLNPWIFIDLLIGKDLIFFDILLFGIEDHPELVFKFWLPLIVFFQLSLFLWMDFSYPSMIYYLGDWWPFFRI